MKRGRRKQWIWKSPKLQEQSHPFGFPTGAFKGQLRTKRHLAVQYIACTADGRKDERDTTLFGGLYIHSHTHRHTHTGYTLTSTLLPTVLSFHLIFCWPVYGGVDRGEHTISWCPNKENWITPGLTSPEQRLAYLYPVLSRGPFRADGWPLLGPWLRGVSASAAGQHDKLYKALSNTWLTRPRPSRPTFTPAPANYPKTQTDDHITTGLTICFLVIFHMLHTHTHIHSIPLWINCVKNVKLAEAAGNKRWVLFSSDKVVKDEPRPQDWLRRVGYVVTKSEHTHTHTACYLVTFSFSILLWLISLQLQKQSDHALLFINHDVSHAFAVPVVGLVHT